MTNERVPRKFIYEVETRFSDLDPYGHLNSKHYLDLVLHGRILFMERTLGITMASVAKGGYGFFLRSVQQNFKKSISGVTTVRMESFAEKFDGTRITIAFMLDDGKGKLYSDGKLEFVVVDLKTGAPAAAPDWMIDIIFEPVA